jgi:very-short-patch-repair endonuclease
MREDNRKLRNFARRMRKEPAPAEVRLWRLLRNRRLVGYKFRRQHPFGPYILDAYCPAARLVIELDGDTHAGDGAAKRDAGRTEYLERRGLKVLRFWNVELAENEEGIVSLILTECARRAGTPPAEIGITTEQAP